MVAVGLNGKTSVSKGGISREVVIVEKSKEEFDFVGDFEFPNPSQENMVLRMVEILSCKVLISRFGKEGAISSRDPKRSVILYPRIRFKEMLEAALQGLWSIKGKGSEVSSPILPIRGKL